MKLIAIFESTLGIFFNIQSVITHCFNLNNYRQGYVCTTNCNFYTNPIFLKRCLNDFCNEEDVHTASSINATSIIFDKPFYTSLKVLNCTKPMMFLMDSTRLHQGDYFVKIDEIGNYEDTILLYSMVFSFVIINTILIQYLLRNSNSMNGIFPRNLQFNEMIQENHEDSFAKLDIYKNIEKSESSDNKSCAICIEDYKDNDEIGILFCNHMFHKNCMTDWNKNSNRCPLCNIESRS